MRLTELSCGLPVSLLPVICSSVNGSLQRKAFHSSAWNSLQKSPVYLLEDDERHNDWYGERDLFLSVLSASTTRRDAKSYLSRFQPPTTNNKDPASDPEAGLAPPIHVALVKIRAPQTLEQGVVAGLAQTLSQLQRLGLTSIVVLDCTADRDSGDKHTDRATSIAQANRLVSAIGKSNGVRARRLDHILGVSPEMKGSTLPVPVIGAVSVQLEEVLFRTLASGTIPVIPPVAYTTDVQKATDVDADEVLLALTRQFVGLEFATGRPTRKVAEESSSDEPPGEQNKPAVSVERIIVLDPLGSLPSATRADKAHVFVNLEQEYRDIKDELQKDNQPDRLVDLGTPEATYSRDNKKATAEEQGIAKQGDISKTNAGHLRNLSLLQRSLSLLPSSSSAVLTTPAEAATFRPSETSAAADLGVGTRRPRNPLIFNLLTDKPLVSSSLPSARLRPSGGASYVQTGQATFVKRGMSLTMIPDPRHEAWEPPRRDARCLSLDDPRIDFGRLLNLIEDSFNRPLNVEHFIKRIRNRIAGIIVAGEYEGGALLTWELPPGVPDDGSEESRRRMVPYLDKFAVLKRSQGGGGVADIVFSAMVRSCFPGGVCWRSRKDNPVNKWYFERSLGTLKLPETQWSMFWTTEGLVEDKQRLLDYEGVCKSVEPSWADQKQPD